MAAPVGLRPTPSISRLSSLGQIHHKPRQTNEIAATMKPRIGKLCPIILTIFRLCDDLRHQAANRPKVPISIHGRYLPAFFRQPGGKSASWAS